MRSRAVTFTAGDETVLPLMATRPAAIHSSASRREHRPARAITLAMRSSPRPACGERAPPPFPPPLAGGGRVGAGAGGAHRRVGAGGTAPPPRPSPRKRGEGEEMLRDTGLSAPP